MTFKISLTICLSIITSTTYAQLKCCTGGENVLGKGKCADGSLTITLNCDSKYLIAPSIDEAEQFHVDADKNLVIERKHFIEDAYITEDKYCLSQLPSDNATVALVCFEKTDDSSEIGWILRSVASLISVVFLIATNLVYFLVPSLRDLQGKCLSLSMFGLMVAFLVLAIIQLAPSLSSPFCEIFGYTTYYSFMVAFFWLNVVSFQIWKTVVKPTILGTDKQWYLIYCCYAFGVPSIYLMTAIAAHLINGDHVKPGIGVASCWFYGDKATWIYFYGTISILLLINLILFIWTVLKLWNDVNKNCTGNKLKSLRYKCLMYMKLFAIMGLTWIFEIFSFAFEGKGMFLEYIWIVTDYLNALQGLLIFILLVLLRKRALKGLANRGLCCINFPRAWTTLHDEENDEILEEEALAANTTA